MDNENATCKLCERQAELKNSHILPKFVGRYIKETSATGFMTALDELGNSERSQDLYKKKLLCGECEGILNEAETFFADNLFYPYKDNKLSIIPIDERISRFAVSVSLRAIWVMEAIGHPLAVKCQERLRSLEDEWKSYLLREKDFKKGEFSHHVIFSNEELLKLGVRGSPNLIHSVMRSSAYYIFEKFEKSYVFSNLAGVQIISMISHPRLPLSKGTEVYPEQKLGVESPGLGWGGYFQNLLFLDKMCSQAKASLSEKGNLAIQKSMNKNPEKVSQSEDYRIFMIQNEILNGKQKET